MSERHPGANDGVYEDDKKSERRNAVEFALITIGVVVCCFLVGCATIAACYFGLPWLWRHALVHVPWLEILGFCILAVVGVIAFAGTAMIGFAVIDLFVGAYQHARNWHRAVGMARAARRRYGVS